MRELDIDVAIIGGGPAGLAAALEVARAGRSAAILERNTELGGILQQCIHDGFGLLRFGTSMSGCSYAQRFIDDIESARADGAQIEVLLDTMVLELTPDREIWATNPADGMVHVRAGAVVLAMGCRERTAAQVLLHGHRPQGVITAGAAQRYINVEGYLPGTHAVILGSGDIGLIMARRMTLEGIEVEGVYEIMDHPGGLARNIVQCLDDYGIPLHLSHMVSRVHGKHRLEGVTVAERGGDGRPIEGTERFIPCDLLVLAVGLIPENELSRACGVELDPSSRGPLLDEAFMTSIPGVFAAGNVSIVYDLVDYVSESGELAARSACAWLDAGRPSAEPVAAVETSGNVGAFVPQRMRTEAGTSREVRFFCRVQRPAENVEVRCVVNGEVIARERHMAVAPASMLSFSAEIPAGAVTTLEIVEVG